MSHQVLEQLKVYLDRETHARLGVWFNGVDFKVIYKTPGGFEIAPEGTPIPRPSDPLVDRGELKVMDGHGSPSSHVHGRGEIPYVKVVDIKNWRVIENPKYAIPSDVASKLRRGKTLQPFDLVTPTRASKNIGLFGVIMPWQTHVILTREIAVWRVASRTASPWLLLALMSLKVVHDQFTPLITMQMNREDLGTRYRKVLLPIPRRADARERWAGPVRSYIESIVNSRSSYEALTAQLDPSLFADRP